MDKEEEQELEKIESVLCPHHFEPPSPRYCQDCEYCSLCDCGLNVFSNAMKLYTAGCRKADEVRLETASEIFRKLDDIIFYLSDDGDIQESRLRDDIKNYFYTKFSVEVDE